jgi:hypothetical protein
MSVYQIGKLRVIDLSKSEEQYLCQVKRHLEKSWKLAINAS